MPWSTGQSGNPRGRPRKGRSVTELIEKLGQGKRENVPLTRLEELLSKLYELAIRGDVAAAKVILAYAEGMPLERVQAEIGTMPPFTADEAAQAQSRLLAFRTRLGMHESHGSDEPTAC